MNSPKLDQSVTGVPQGQPTIARRFNSCFLFLALLAAPAAGLGQQLEAGIARTDITPEQPVTLAGYESRKDLSKGVHDPLSARAIAFRQAEARLVLVSLDNLGFYNGTAKPLRQAVLDACKLKPSELFLCAIHTHSAPALTLTPGTGHPNNLEYTRKLQQQLVEVVRNALARVAPVQVGSGSGSAPVGVNRREVVTDKSGERKIVLGRNPSIPIDRQVQVLKLVRTGETGLSGALFAYSTHSTSLGPRNYLISGDIHGIAEQFLEHYYGADIAAAGFAGASGNIDPWFRVLPDFRTNNGWLPEPMLLGTFLGEEVARVLDGLQVTMSNAPIKTLFKTVELPAKPRNEGGASSDGTVPLNISTACLGDIAFVGLGGEVFNELGQAIKSGSPFRYTFIFTHCNGAAGYVPTRPSYAEGGYEVQSSQFAPGAGEALVQEALRLLQELKASE